MVCFEAKEQNPPGPCIHMGLSENKGVPSFGVRLIRILRFRVLYRGPLFSETPI